MAEKTLLEKIVESLSPANIQELVLAENWALFNTPDTNKLKQKRQISAERDLVVDTKKPRSVLSYVTRPGATVNDLAKFIEVTGTQGTTDKASARKQTLELLAKDNNVLSIGKLPWRRGIGAVAEQVAKIVEEKTASQKTRDKDGKKVVATVAIIDSADADVTYLADYIRNHKNLLTERKVDLVPVVLASAAAKRLEAIKSNDPAKAAEAAEYEKAIMPLVYGLITQDTFTSNKGSTQSEFSGETQLSKVQDQVIDCLEKDGYDADLVKKYFHNLTLCSHLYDVDKKVSTEWDANISKDSKNLFVTLLPDGDRLVPLSTLPEFNEFEAAFNQSLSEKNLGDSALNDPEKLLPVLVATAGKLVEEGKLDETTSKTIATSIARALIGGGENLAKYTITPTLKGIGRKGTDGGSSSSEKSMWITKKEREELRHVLTRHEYVYKEEIAKCLGVKGYDGLLRYPIPENLTKLLLGNEKLTADDILAVATGKVIIPADKLEKVKNAYSANEESWAALVAQIHLFGEEYSVDPEKIDRALHSENPAEQLKELAPSANDESIQELLKLNDDQWDDHFKYYDAKQALYNFDWIDGEYAEEHENEINEMTKQLKSSLGWLTDEYLKTNPSLEDMKKEADQHLKNPEADGGSGGSGDGSTGGALGLVDKNAKDELSESGALSFVVEGEGETTAESTDENVEGTTEKTDDESEDKKDEANAETTAEPVVSTDENTDEDKTEETVVEEPKDVNDETTEPMVATDETEPVVSTEEKADEDKTEKDETSDKAHEHSKRDAILTYFDLPTLKDFWEKPVLEEIYNGLPTEMEQTRFEDECGAYWSKIVLCAEALYDYGILHSIPDDYIKLLFKEVKDGDFSSSDNDLAQHVLGILPEEEMKGGRDLLNDTALAFKRFKTLVLGRYTVADDADEKEERKKEIAEKFDSIFGTTPSEIS